MMSEKNFTRKQLIFPLFNGVVAAALGALIGYYISQLYTAVFFGLAGFLLGLLVEFLLYRPQIPAALYRRRLLLTVLLEIPIFIFIIGPYAFVLRETRAGHREICCRTPLDFGAEAYEDIQIKMEDGVILSGWYIPPADSPGPLVVVLHGAHSDRRGSIWHAEQLIEAGYGVLMYDQRALGESTGEKVSLSWYDGPDLVTAVGAVTDRPEVDGDRIGAVGLSGGAHVALNAAYLDPDSMDGLWLDGLQAQRIADFPAPLNVGEQFATFMNYLILRMAELHLGRPAPPPFVDILEELEEPEIVIIAGGLEEFERRAGEKYTTVVGENAEVWIIEDAWHLGGNVVIPERYTDRMLSFFETTLAEN